MNLKEDAEIYIVISLDFIDTFKNKELVAEDIKNKVISIDKETNNQFRLARSTKISKDTEYLIYSNLLSNWTYNVYLVAEFEDGTFSEISQDTVTIAGGQKYE